jgi:hypothetical protein
MAELERAWMAGTRPAMTAEPAQSTACRDKSQQFCCGKSEIELSSAHEQFGASACQRRQASASAPPTLGKTAQKNLLAKIHRNPLKSLDSDERIQGNPRKSNSRESGFSR